MKVHTTIYLIRHGEVHNPDEILYARLPGFFLSENGRQQAAAAAAALRDRPLAAIYSSPMERAQETASYIQAEHPALQVQTEQRLQEVHTMYEGRPLAELERIGFDLYSGAPARYEQPDAILARVLDFFAHVRRVHRGQEVAAVSHGDVVVFSFLYARRAAPRVQAKGDLSTVYGLPDPYPATASINTFTFSTDDPDEIPAYHYRRPY